MNTPYALILTDSTHAPTVIGHYNSRQTIDEIRSAIRSYFTDDEPVLPTDIIPGTAQVLNECRAVIKAHHNHFVNLRSLALDVTAFLIPSDHPEYKGIFADRREIPAADLDSITWF